MTFIQNNSLSGEEEHVVVGFRVSSRDRENSEEGGGETPRCIDRHTARLSHRPRAEVRLEKMDASHKLRYRTPWSQRDATIDDNLARTLAVYRGL